MARTSYRGTGRDAGGPLTSTVKIHDYIKHHPGVTRDAVIKVAMENEWVHRGYAHRIYLAHLNRQRSLAARPASDIEEIATCRSDQAVRYVLMGTLRNMRQHGSIANEGGRLYVCRDLSKIKGLTNEEILAPPEQTRQHLAQMELLRDLRPILDRLEDSHYKLPLTTRRKLKAWAEATMVHPPNGR